MNVEQSVDVENVREENRNIDVMVKINERKIALLKRLGFLKTLSE